MRDHDTFGSHNHDTSGLSSGDHDMGFQDYGYWEFIIGIHDYYNLGLQQIWDLHLATTTKLGPSIGNYNKIWDLL